MQLVASSRELIFYGLCFKGKQSILWGFKQIVLQYKYRQRSKEVFRNQIMPLNPYLGVFDMILKVTREMMKEKLIVIPDGRCSDPPRVSCI